MGYRTIAIYGVFVITVAYGIYFHFLSDNSVKIVPVGSATAAGPLSIAPHARQDISSARNPSGSIYISDSWKKDPFRIDRGERLDRVATNSNMVPLFEKPRLSAISKSGYTRAAVVNGKIMQIGESIGGWRLINITDDSALFESPVGPEWVKLGG